MEQILKDLDENQIKFASEIAANAEKFGIDPKLAVALAYRESKLRPFAEGGKGEIGIMQVMPSTGKLLGFSADDLKNPNKNIAAGLTYLKQNLDRYNDPVMAVAAYNAGPDHPYFKDPEKHSLPESTLGYLKDIRDYGGFQASAPQAETQGGAEVKTVDIGSTDEAAQNQFLQENKARLALDLLGMGAGAATAKAADLLSGAGKTVSAIQAIPELLRGQAAAEGTSGQKWLKNWGNIEKPGFAGGVPEAAQQYAKMQPAPESKIMSRLSKRGLLGAPQPVQPGVFTGGQLSISGQPPAPVSPGPLSRTTGMIGRGAGAVLSSPITMGALGGLSAAEQGQEFAKRYADKDVPGMMISGAGALGGLMQMVPHPATRAVGVGFSTASPLAMAVYDRIRSEQSPLDATKEELLSAARPPALDIVPRYYPRVGRVMAP